MIIPGTQLPNCPNCGQDALFWDDIVTVAGMPFGPSFKCANCGGEYGENELRQGF